MGRRISRIFPAAGFLLISAQVVSAQGNGIVVGQPKVYEDEMLRSMLANTETSLAQLKFIDQGAIANRIGGVQGAAAEQNAVSISANGPSIPGLQTTSNAPTTSSVLKTDNLSTTGTSTGTAGNTTGTSQDTNNAVTSAGATTQTVASRAAANPATPQLANTGAPAFPTNFTVGASTTLNEQMQLSFEAANLRLLLDGALDDRYTPAGVARRRATIGFPISIEPNRRDRKAVAEVEVRVSPLLNAGVGSLAAVLPREKTYNVASLTSSSFGLGGGVVTQVFSLGGNFLHSRQTYYLVQDQDTTATQFPGSATAAAFGWEFKPVLGRSTVQAGLRQTFAQMTFPVGPEVGCLAAVQVITRWRKYDSKTGTLGAAFDEQTGAPAYVRAYNNLLSGYQLRWEDLGDGTVQVVIGNAISGIPPGTRVLLGNGMLDQSTPGFQLENSAIRFVAAIDALTRARPRLLTRDGAEIELRDPDHPDTTSSPLTGCPGDPSSQGVPPRDAPAAAPFSISAVTLTPFDSTQSRITVTLSEPVVQQSQPALITIGGKTFGLHNAPYLSVNGDTLTFLAPTAALRNLRVLQAQRLFQGAAFHSERAITFPDDFAPTTLTVLSQNDAQTTLLLTGSDVSDITVLTPAATVNALGPTAARIIIGTALLPNNRQLVLQKNSGVPFVLPLPSAPPAKPSFGNHDPVTTGTGTVVVAGTLLKQIDSLQVGNTQLFFSVSDDGSNVTINLPDSLVKDPGMLVIHMVSKDGSGSDYKIGVKRP
jgi:hypothetical protein